jgi:hypothetical protein
MAKPKCKTYDVNVNGKTLDDDSAWQDVPNAVKKISTIPMADQDTYNKYFTNVPHHSRIYNSMNEGRQQFDQELYRGTRNPMNYPVGQKVILGQRSYSTKKERASVFGENTTMITLKGKKHGTSLKEHSIKPFQNEVKLKSGTRGKVTKVYQDRGIKHVEIDTDSEEDAESKAVDYTCTSADY